MTFLNPLDRFIAANPSSVVIKYAAYPKCGPGQIRFQDRITISAGLSAQDIGSILAQLQRMPCLTRVAAVGSIDQDTMAGRYSFAVLDGTKTPALVQAIAQSIGNLGVQARLLDDLAGFPFNGSRTE